MAPALELWNEWEIHVLILASFALQVFLFLAADTRRRSSSGVFRAMLWLAYLSADSVAIFVLGHLAMRGCEPQRELVLLWAPLVLVHLGGQDSITAFSKQDNELWLRHLLGFLTQVGVAGYVVSRSSWPDGRLRAAMVLIFLSGCVKYAGRIWCLYSAAIPASLGDSSLRSLSRQLFLIRQASADEDRWTINMRLRERLKLLLTGRGSTVFGIDVQYLRVQDLDIMIMDAPLNDVGSVELAEAGKLAELKSDARRGMAYQFVAARLLHCYHALYTKSRLLENSITFVQMLGLFLCSNCDSMTFLLGLHLGLSILLIWLQYLLTLVALMLFAFAMADERGHLHTRADVTVSYVLLVGAVILDMATVLMGVCHGLGKRRKQWSGVLAQYNMIMRYTKQDKASMLSHLKQWIRLRLAAWGVDFLDPSLTQSPIHEDLKGFVLDGLLEFGTREKKYWDFASSRGRFALDCWKGSRKPPPSATKALNESITDVDFTSSVLIWHIATDICYFNGDTSEYDDMKKKKISRELSNYIMYLVFKCGVMLTTSYQIVHHHALQEMKQSFESQNISNLGEKEAYVELYKWAERTNMPDYFLSTEWRTVGDERQRHVTCSPQDLNPVQRNAWNLSSSVLKRAYKVAQELIGLHKMHDSWDLIAAVWLEMLFYAAPRCGGAFHYEHLAKGGEFATHVLLLMRYLGPFLPIPVL